MPSDIPSPSHPPTSRRREPTPAGFVDSGGLNPKLIFWEGVGPRQPVNVTKFCDAKMNRKQLIDCLAPNRRTTVEVTGTRPPKPAAKPAAAKPAAKPAAKM